MDKTNKNSVLIVDDEVANLVALSDILSPEYTVYGEKNGRDAIETAKMHLPDVILLDILMPEMDGYEVLSLLKSEETTREIPVIFVTGLVSNEDEEKGLDLGAADYIAKPFTPAIVRLRVRKLIQMMNLSQQSRLKAEIEIALAKAQEASRAKSEFLSRMSHEMRTPMNAIMGMTQIAKITDDPQKRLEHLNKIDGASRDLLCLIDDVLDVSRVEHGTFKLVDFVFDFNAMVRDILQMANYNTAEKQQVFIYNISPEIPTMLIGDEKRLKQVVVSLISNAVKYTPENGKIHFAASVLEANSEIITLQFVISDTGIGIAEEKQNDIFSLFEQADGGLTRKHGGIGLGLALSRTIIKLMGGDISFDSQPGKGSEFVFTCKLKQTDYAGGPSADLTGKCVLVVDDMEFNRVVVNEQLREIGVETVIEAENGKEAVGLFLEMSEKIDLILMDIMMPEMDGYEATRKIRKSGLSKAADIPIVALTALTKDEDVEAAKNAGMDYHIGKPSDAGQLLDVLKRFLL